jgi:hypothetical protein
MKLSKTILVVALWVAGSVLAQVDSNMPEEGVLPVSKLPVVIVRAANDRCSGLLITSAEFSWRRDDGVYRLEGRCEGQPVRLDVAGSGKVVYFTRMERAR